MRKISNKRLLKLQAESGTRILRKGEVIAKKVEKAVESPRGIPEDTVVQLLDSHDKLMGQVTELKGAMATERVWEEMVFSVSRKRSGMADQLSVKSVSGASALFSFTRDAEGFISGMRTIRSNPEISLNFEVIRDKNNVLQQVVVT